MYLYPDLDTFTIFPWRPQQGKVARIICDIYCADKTPFTGDSRYILKRQIEEAKKLGYTFNVGPECEFFLFHQDENGQPTTLSHEKAGYFDLGPVDLGENARRDMVLTLEDMGYEIEASHHEVAPAQHEIDFKYDEALQTADNIMTFKLAVKTIAKRHGLFASFMPKPKYGINGYIAWSATNRSPLIRIPASRGEETRVELRSPDPAANPYLALAVCLAAGIDGIRNKIEPPEEVPENVYELKEEEKASRGIESLPADLHAAICELQKDAFIKEVLGEHISSKLIEAKEAEWMQYRTQVTGWEIEEYLYKI